MSAATFSGLIDLAAAGLGGRVLGASDEFFAEAANLLQSGRAVFVDGKFTERGKWMDGWESRRKRVPGHDWCVVRLGLPGRIRGFEVDTNHFLGNYPEHCSVEACTLESEPTDWASAPWEQLVPISELEGGTQHYYPVAST
ncbi:MAG TPA: allantoicase, partial [Polyangia bacterium]|nr:allantoicase [Polyangia bacterium]